MYKKSQIFEKTYKNYLNAVHKTNLKPLTNILGIEIIGDLITIPLYEEIFFIGKDFIIDHKGAQPRHSVSVLLCQYILLAPKFTPQLGPLVTYKDFKDAAPFVGGFTDLCEKPIVDNFTRKLRSLEYSSRMIGGRSIDLGVTCDISYKFEALPKVPIYMLFNDADDEFPAKCTLIFHENAHIYLDMECLAILANQLSFKLMRFSK